MVGKLRDSQFMRNGRTDNKEIIYHNVSCVSKLVTY